MKKQKISRKSRRILRYIFTFIFMASCMHVMAQAPSATTNAATGIGAAGATVNGTVNANGLSTTVYFEYGLTNEYGQTMTAAESPVTGSTGTAVSANLFLLNANNTYHYRVVATSSGGTTYGADMTFTTTASGGTVPVVITDAATGIGADFATLNGRVNTFGVSTTVVFHWGLDTNYGNSATADQSPLTSSAFDPVTATITGLANNTTYHYRVAASNINGTTYGSDMTFTIGSAGSAPTATTNAATGIGSTTATMNGTVNANGDSTAVSFEYGLDTGYGSTVVASPTPISGSTDTAVSATIASFLPNTTYHYRVVGTNTNGTTNGSDMTFTTLPSAPTVTTTAASPVGTTSATLNGTVNANSGSSTVTFEYGLDTSYGTTVTAAQSPVTGSTDTAVSSAITGLTNGVTYHYRVAATNAGGTSYGADMTFTTGTTPPTATTNAASGIGSTTATLNGTVNANGSSTTVTFEYGETTAYGRTATAAQSPVTGSTGTAVSSAISSLTSGVTYHYRVIAVNAGGTTYGADMTFSTLAAPTVTTNPASAVSTTGATLNGTVNANGVSTTVTFEYGTDTSYGTTVTADQSPVTGSTDTAVSHAITGLSSGTTYHYRAVGQNANGTTYGADMTFIASAPAAPTVTTDAASHVMQNGAVLNGTVNANNASTTVTFEYGIDTGYGSTVTADQSPVTGSADTAVSATITGLTLGQLYHYRVVGANGNGTTNGGDMVFTTTTAPVAVTEAATSVGPTTATLHGTANANGDGSVVLSFYYSADLPLYNLYSPASPTTISGSTDYPITTTLTGLTPNTTYYYRIYASNSLTQSTFGDGLTFTTLPADTAPTAVTDAATGVGTTSATLNGTVNANSTTTTVTFEYGLDTNYGQTLYADQTPVTGSTDTAVSVDATTLTPNTTYHYRVVAQNSGNTVNGADMTFTTGGAPPTADTGAATAVTATSATVNGIVNANNDSTTVTFEYGLTTAYGSVATAVQSPVTGSSNTAVNAALAGLTTNTTYHYRVVAQNSSGTTNGADMTFFTGTAVPTVTTNAATGISPTGATFNGTVNANNGSTTVTFEYGETTGYGRTATADQSPVTGSTDTAVSVSVNDLTPDTTYHFRAVGQNASGTAYGSDLTFTTNVADSPTVTTASVTNITAVSAVSGGNVTDEGGASVTARGVCWSTNPGPTTADNVTSNGTGTGVFTSNITGLNESTIYHVRAYAENAYGTAYGEELEFTTNALGTPTVSTAAVTDITDQTATSGGNVTDNGGAAVTARGVCWSTAPNPTIANNRTTNGSGNGSFTSYLTNLTADTAYYVRAYATNAGGTGYGEQRQFSTNSASVNVAITNPADGDWVAGVVNVTADASAGGGATISRVEFYIDGTQIAQDTSSPYQTNWDTTTYTDGSHTVTAIAYASNGSSSQDDITVTVSNGGGGTPIILNRTKLNFGSVGGTHTGAQTFSIDSSTATLNWTLAKDAAWLSCTPVSGSGPGVVTVTVDPSGMAAGTYSAEITITDTITGTSKILPVALVVYSQGSTTAPFGNFATPLNNSTVTSSIPVTGWVLDDIQTMGVEIYRDPVTGEGTGLVYVGDAVFVDGARPDVEAAYPDYPMNYQAGWGYMLLTYGLPNQGNGTYKLYAIAVDAEGKTVTLGTKTITCVNASAVKPFGAIDTPTQGGTASGAAFVNFGWALTPQPNTIPTDGSTITVWVDGVPLGHPVYNEYRADVAALFPGYNNTNGAGGHYYLDTTAYDNGVHTISWSVTDDGGNADGIGSRYFSIQNNGTSDAAEAAETAVPKTIDIGNIYREFPAVFTAPLTGGLDNVTIKELDYMIIHIAENPEAVRGYLEANGRLNPLPIGSTLDTENGIFFWQPGPGFMGQYTLVFDVVDSSGNVDKRRVTITIESK